MEMMKALFPVLSMMLIGMFCRKSGLISEKGIQDLKTLMTQIILPVAVSTPWRRLNMACISLVWWD